MRRSSDAAAVAPVFEGDLQRCFTGCYTSLSRLKRRAVTSLGTPRPSRSRRGGVILARRWRLSRARSPRSLEAPSIQRFSRHPHGFLRRAGRAGRPGSIRPRRRYCQVGRSFAAISALNQGSRNGPALPITVFNANPSLRRAPVEFECMADHRPFWKGTWRLRLFRADGREILCQEEQPEALLPFNNWRRRISFVDDLPGVGVSRYYLKTFEIPEGEPKAEALRPIRRSSPLSLPSQLPCRLDPRSGLVHSLKPDGFPRPIAGPLFEPLVIEDTGDSWGTGCGSYRKVVGRFRPSGPSCLVESGPVRTIMRAVFAFDRSRIVMDTVAYPSWPVLEFRIRVVWNEERRRLKLGVPIALTAPELARRGPGRRHPQARGRGGARSRPVARRRRSIGRPARFPRHRLERPAWSRFQGGRDPPVCPSQLRVLP